LKEEDQSKACQAFQEIETDLVYRVIETYENKEFEEFAEALEALDLFLEVSRKICIK
jgi:hypothetical protein